MQRPVGYHPTHLKHRKNMVSHGLDRRKKAKETQGIY